MARALFCKPSPLSQADSDSSFPLPLTPTLPRHTTPAQRLQARFEQCVFSPIAQSPLVLQRSTPLASTSAADTSLLCSSVVAETPPSSRQGYGVGRLGGGDNRGESVVSCSQELFASPETLGAIAGDPETLGTAPDPIPGSAETQRLVKQEQHVPEMNSPHDQVIDLNPRPPAEVRVVECTPLREPSTAADSSMHHNQSDVFDMLFMSGSQLEAHLHSSVAVHETPPGAPSGEPSETGSSGTALDTAGRGGQQHPQNEDDCCRAWPQDNCGNAHSQDSVCPQEGCLQSTAGSVPVSNMASPPSSICNPLAEMPDNRQSPAVGGLPTSSAAVSALELTSAQVVSTPDTRTPRQEPQRPPDPSPSFKRRKLAGKTFLYPGSRQLRRGKRRAAPGMTGPLSNSTLKSVEQCGKHGTSEADTSSYQAGVSNAVPSFQTTSRCKKRGLVTSGAPPAKNPRLESEVGGDGPEVEGGARTAVPHQLLDGAQPLEISERCTDPPSLESPTTPPPVTDNTAVTDANTCAEGSSTLAADTREMSNWQPTRGSEGSDAVTVLNIAAGVSAEVSLSVTPGAVPECPDGVPPRADQPGKAKVLGLRRGGGRTWYWNRTGNESSLRVINSAAADEGQPRVHYGTTSQTADCSSGTSKLPLRPTASPPQQDPEPESEPGSGSESEPQVQAQGSTESVLEDCSTAVVNRGPPPTSAMTEPAAPFVGFQMASGKAVQISRRALRKARQLLEETEAGQHWEGGSPHAGPMPAVPSAGTASRTPGFTTPRLTENQSHSGTPFQFKAPLMRTPSAVVADTPASAFKAPSSTPAPTTSTSRPVTVPRRVLSVQRRPGRPFKAPRLASRVSQTEEQHAIAKILGSFRAAGATTDCQQVRPALAGSERPAIESGFSTAGGRRLSVSAQALRQAQLMMAEDKENGIAGDVPAPTGRDHRQCADWAPQPSDSDKLLSGFKTASGKDLRVSASALQRAERALACVNTDTAMERAEHALACVNTDTALERAECALACVNTDTTLERAERALAWVNTDTALERAEHALACVNTDTALERAECALACVNTNTTLERAEHALACVNTDTTLERTERALACVNTDTTLERTERALACVNTDTTLERTERALACVNTDTAQDSLQPINIPAAAPVSVGTGFQTASGKSLSVSSSSLARARAIVASVPVEDSQLPSELEAADKALLTGFQTAGGRGIAVAHKSFESALRLAEEGEGRTVELPPAFTGNQILGGRNGASVTENQILLGGRNGTSDTENQILLGGQNGTSDTENQILGGRNGASVTENQILLGGRNGASDTENQILGGRNGASVTENQILLGGRNGASDTENQILGGRNGASVTENQILLGGRNGASDTENQILLGGRNGASVTENQILLGGRNGASDIGESTGHTVEGDVPTIPPVNELHPSQEGVDFDDVDIDTMGAFTQIDFHSRARAGEPVCDRAVSESGPGEEAGGFPPGEADSGCYFSTQVVRQLLEFSSGEESDEEAGSSLIPLEPRESSGCPHHHSNQETPPSVEDLVSSPPPSGQPLRTGVFQSQENLEREAGDAVECHTCPSHSAPAQGTKLPDNSEHLQTTLSPSAEERSVACAHSVVLTHSCPVPGTVSPTALQQDLSPTERASEQHGTSLLGEELSEGVVGALDVSTAGVGDEAGTGGITNPGATPGDAGQTTVTVPHAAAAVGSRVQEESSLETARLPRDQEQPPAAGPERTHGSHTGSFPGLQTASGKEVHISQQALAAVRQTQGSHAGSFPGLQTASGKEVHISQQALAAVRQTQGSHTGSFPGLQTASGKKVHISQQALAAVRQTQGSHTGSFPGLQTASGKEVHISQQALAAVRQTQGSHTGSFPGLQTASGKTVAVTQESLNHVRKSLEVSTDCETQQPGRAIAGLQTASGKTVEISEASLRAVRSLVQEGTDTGRSHPGFPGLQTASGRKVGVSQSSLQAARRALQLEVRPDLVAESGVSAGSSVVEEGPRAPLLTVGTSGDGTSAPGVGPSLEPNSSADSAPQEVPAYPRLSPATPTAAGTAATPRAPPRYKPTFSVSRAQPTSATPTSATPTSAGSLPAERYKPKFKPGSAMRRSVATTSSFPSAPPPGPQQPTPARGVTTTPEGTYCNSVILCLRLCMVSSFQPLLVLVCVHCTAGVMLDRAPPPGRRALVPVQTFLDQDGVYLAATPTFRCVCVCVCVCERRLHYLRSWLNLRFLDILTMLEELRLQLHGFLPRLHSSRATLLPPDHSDLWPYMVPIPHKLFKVEPLNTPAEWHPQLLVLPVSLVCPEATPLRGDQCHPGQAALRCGRHRLAGAHRAGVRGSSR